MNDIYSQLVGYVRASWGRRWYAIAVAWFICGIGWSIVAIMPDRYESSARTYVDVDTMLGPLMKGMTVEMNIVQQIDMMRRTLLSIPNLEKVLLTTDLDLRVKTPEDKEKLLNNLERQIKVVQQGRNLFQISYENKDPVLAKRVVQAVMQVFVEGNLGASRKDMDTTQRFLDTQIRDYERQLVAAEARRAQFKQRNMGLLPGSGNYYSHMQNMKQKLSQVDAAIEEAEMVRNEYSAQLASIPPYTELPSTATTDKGRGPESDLNLRLLDLQLARESLLSRYTEKHPDVMTVTRQIEAVQKQITEQMPPLPPTVENVDTSGVVAATADPSHSGESDKAPIKKNLVPNPIYDQIKLKLVNQEGVIAALKSRAADAKREYEKWSAMAQLVPEIEAQLAQLDRDYGIIKGAYDQLRQRQEKTKLSREMDVRAQKVQFRVIDPPYVPVTPSGPNRPLLMSVVLLVSLGAGAAVAFILSQINTVFLSVRDLRAAFTLPVLGRVSDLIISSGERRRRARGAAGFAVATVSLFLTYGALLTLSLLGFGETIEKISGLRNLL